MIGLLHSEFSTRCSLPVCSVQASVKKPRSMIFCSTLTHFSQNVTCRTLDAGSALRRSSSGAQRTCRRRRNYNKRPCTYVTCGLNDGQGAIRPTGKSPTMVSRQASPPTASAHTDIWCDDGDDGYASSLRLNGAHHGSCTN